MNFQGPRDLTPYTEQYKTVVTFLLYIENSYPGLFESLRQAPQFEYEVEVCRFKRRWARKYLLMLKALVKDHMKRNHAAREGVELQEEHPSMFGPVYKEVVRTSHPWQG